MLNELNLATIKGFKSKHDDVIDTITMLGEINAWKPSEVSTEIDENGRSAFSKYWDEPETAEEGNSSYFV